VSDWLLALGTIFGVNLVLRLGGHALAALRQARTKPLR
jgi:hypothetical protein